MNNEQIELILTQYLKDLKKTDSEKEMSEIIEIMTTFLTETNKKQLEECISKLQQLSESDGPCRMAAIWLLGFCSLEGFIVSKDLGLAIQFFEEAAKENFAPAINHLGYCYGEGVGVQKNVNRAFEFYSKASELNFTIAHFNRGLCYQKGTGVQKSYKLGFDYLNRAAKEEYAKAQYEVGLCYRYICGTEANFDEAFKIFKKLEEKAHRDATYQLGLCYCAFYEGRRNVNEAIKYLEKASNLGSIRAQIKLGKIFLDEKEHVNIKKAIEYFQLAFENGSMEAASHLAELYESSVYGVQDFSLVLKYSLEIFKEMIIESYSVACPEQMKEIEETMELNDVKKILDLYNPYVYRGDCPAMLISKIKSLKYLWTPSKTELFFQGYDPSGGYSIFTNELKHIFREYEGDELSDSDEDENEKKEERPKNN